MTVVGACEVEVEPTLGATFSFFKDFKSTAERIEIKVKIKQSEIYKGTSICFQFAPSHSRDLSDMADKS